MIETDNSMASSNMANQEESQCKDIIMTDDKAKKSGSFIEMVIMSWTKEQQDDYVKSIKQPTYGIKKN